MLLTEKEKVRSLFIDKYKDDIAFWLKKITSLKKDILAVSRKGPRFIELLYKDGLVGEEFMNRIFSEHAIAFVRSVDGLVVVDDSVLHGTTLENVINLACYQFSLKKNSIGVMPFKYSVNTKEAVKNIVDKDVSKLMFENESSVFISDLIYSFKSLGKPYDIEHPIVYIYGDFSDREMLKIKLLTIADEIGKCDLIEYDNISFPDSYTLLINTGNNRGCDDGCEFSKIRVFVNSDYSRLAIVPMSPYMVSDEDIDIFSNGIEGELREIWDYIYSFKRSVIDESAFYRSLVVIVNYINSFKLFSTYKLLFKEYFQIEKFEFKLFDLQLLIGYDIALNVIDRINAILNSNSYYDLYKANCANYSEITELVFTDQQKKAFEDYFYKKPNILEHSTSEHEIINHIFYSQHKLEIETRNDLVDQNRLMFGFTLVYIRDMVSKIIPNCSLKEIHASIDMLIDCGAIVPKYMNIGKENNRRIWSRVFRVGEGPLPTSQKILMISRLFNNLKNCYKVNEIPATVFEKYFVLALTNGFGFDELMEKSISGLGIKKKNSLYGARSYIETDCDGSGEYVVKWAKNYGILEQNSKNLYVLNENILKSYDENELGVTDIALDKLEDIALFCYQISKKINDDALVLLTTLSSNKEFWQSISSELGLWLSDPHNNISNCLHKLGEISKKNIDLALLSECNGVLERNANYSAQVTKKKNLYEKRDEINHKINEVVISINDVSINRVWRNLKRYLEFKKNSENENYYIKEILHVLRIAHCVTSLSRVLLNEAGYPVPEKKKDEKGNIIEYLQKIIDLLELKDGSVYLVNHRFEKYGTKASIQRLKLKINGCKEYEEIYKILSVELVKVIDIIYYIYIDYGQDVIRSVPPKTMIPPVYIVMWDIVSSVEISDRVAIEQQLILKIIEKVKNTHSDGVLESVVFTLDDGNKFLTKNFSDVIAAFLIIKKLSKEHGIIYRVGCDVNYEGDLHVYEDKNIITGRAYEYAKRTMDYYKEIELDRNRWIGDLVIEPKETYMLLTEFVKRIAMCNNEWDIALLSENIFKGLYKARVKSGTVIPYGISMIK